MYVKELLLIPFHISRIVEQAFQARTPLYLRQTPIYGCFMGLRYGDGISILKNHYAQLVRIMKHETQVFVIRLAMFCNVRMLLLDAARNPDKDGRSFIQNRCYVDIAACRTRTSLHICETMTDEGGHLLNLKTFSIITDLH